MFTGRGLLGALISFLAVLILLLCLTETRRIGTLSWWGLYHYSRWSRIEHFGFWFPLITTTIYTVPFGYWAGHRLYNLRVWPGVLLGAVLGSFLLFLLAWSNPANHPRADRNHEIIAAMIGLVVGAGLGAEASDRWLSRKKRD